MAQVKTHNTDDSVEDFIEQVPQEQKKKDCYKLIELMEQVTGQKPQMFGASIIGFGKYHYKYDSGHEGEAPILGFSPRKAAISLYVYTQDSVEGTKLLATLGKYKMGKACIYINKLSDLNEDVLIEMMQTSINFISNKYTRLI